MLLLQKILIERGMFYKDSWIMNFYRPHKLAEFANSVKLELVAKQLHSNKLNNLPTFSRSLILVSHDLVVLAEDVLKDIPCGIHLHIDLSW